MTRAHLIPDHDTTPDPHDWLPPPSRHPRQPAPSYRNGSTTLGSATLASGKATYAATFSRRHRSPQRHP